MRNIKDRLTFPPISAPFPAFDMRDLRQVSKCFSAAYSLTSYTFNVEGSLRFQAPQAPAKVDGVQQATSPPPQCYQAGEGTSQTNPFIPNPLLKKRYSTLTSEDCLFLEQVFDFSPFTILIADNKFIVYPFQTSEWLMDCLW
jgi:hypothetical protein